MSANYLPIETIIRLATSEGVSFGRSNPRFHLAYLGKLGLIPHATRRKINGSLTGCYEEAVVETLKRIEALKGQGLSYSQIKKVLGGLVASPTRPVNPSLSTYDYSPTPNRLPTLPTFNPQSTGLAFLIIGLFLGFLAGTRDFKTSDLANPNLINSSPSEAVSTTNSSLDDSSTKVLRLITSGSESSEEPLYIIALPEGNLNRLGKTDINKLLNTN